MRLDRYAEGERQVKAGVSLIKWSRLAVFDEHEKQFSAASEEEFESKMGHNAVDPEYGRLICWLAFSVGSEYLAKGVCLLKGRDPTTTAKVIRAPAWDEGLGGWACLVNAGHTAVTVDDTSLGTLGRLPIRTIKGLGTQVEMVSAAMKFLASTIRNRDAHRYVPEARAAHFMAVPTLLVPAINALLSCLEG